MKYNGPKLIVEEFVKFGIAKDAKLLDVAAGTGLVGLELKANGYTNIDAIDGSEDMLVAAREGNCYKNVMAHMITGDSKIPIPDHTYDHLVMSGALCHIPFENIPQIIRLCKPGNYLRLITLCISTATNGIYFAGGIICWAIAKSEDLVSHVPAFKDGQFEKVIERLCSEKLWEFLPGFPKKAINFTHERDGWTYAMKVL